MLKTLADFKRYAQPGAKLLRGFPETPDREPQIREVIVTRSNAIVFAPREDFPADLVRENPEKNGSWFYWPKASLCKIEHGKLTVMDTQGRAYITLEETQ